MAKSSGPSLFTWLLLGGAAYVAYELYKGVTSVAATAATGTGEPPTATTSTTPASTSTGPPAPSLDSLYQAMLKAATAANFSSGNPDQWCYYFNTANSPRACPSPESLGWDRTNNWPTNLSAGQFWSQAGPKIGQSFGLSGLGFVAGLGALLMRSHDYTNDPLY